MPDCVWLVDKLGKAVGQARRLYALCTGRVYTSRFFVHRPPTGALSLNTIYTSWFRQNLSIKFSFALFTQDLCLQINKERYLSFTNSHLPIKYKLLFTKTSGKWLVVNNLANRKWEMVNEATEGSDS